MVEEKDCLSHYKILSMEESGSFIIKNKETKQEFGLLLFYYNTNDYESQIKLTEDLQFYKAMKDFNLLDAEIIDYCLMNKDFFEKKYIHTKSLLIKPYEKFTEFSGKKNKILFVIVNPKDVSRRFNLSEINIFQLYYELFMLKFNYNIVINDINLSLLRSMKYNKSSSYLICDCFFTIPNVENLILFSLKDIKYYGNIYKIDENVYQDIRDVKNNNILNLSSNIIQSFDVKSTKLYNYIYENFNKPAIEILLKMSMMFECKKITDTDKKELKNLHIVSCEEKRTIDLTKYIPSVGSYHEREKLVPRFIHTGRPISYMIQMCKKLEKYIPSGEEKKEEIICFDNNLFLPVIRYQSLYHPETEKKKYCGTFYYIEPESTVLLNLGKCSVFATKVHAYIALKAKLEGKTREAILDEVFNIDNFKKSMNIDIWKKTRDKLGLNPEQLRVIMVQFYISLLHNENEVQEIPYINTTPLYPTDSSSIWRMYSGKSIITDKIDISMGAHDDFDQDICKMAQSLKIDTLLLQHEMGETRAVTEILDTRDNTYDNLVRVENPKEWYKISKKYSTIWFLDNGFITNMKCKKIDIDREDVNLVKCE